MYLIAAFGLSWAAWGAAIAVGDSPASAGLVLLGGFGPMAAALIATGARDGRAAVWDLLRRYGPRRGGRARAFLTAPAVLLLLTAAAGVALATGASLRPGELSAFLPVLPGLVVMVALVGGGNEELGWRGYLLPALQSTLSPLTANLALGAIWAVWHAPLWWIPGTTQSGLSFPWFAVTSVALSILLSWTTNVANGSILPAVLAHTALNAGLATQQAALGEVSLPATALLLTLAAATLVATTHGRLGTKRPAPSTMHGLDPDLAPSGRR